MQVPPRSGPRSGRTLTPEVRLVSTPPYSRRSERMVTWMPVSLDAGAPTRNDILGKLPDLMLGYARAMMLHLSQGTACGVAHPVRARLARWLLQTSDRTESNDVPLTQQFLSEILGLRRATVTEASGQLQSVGAVRT